MRFSILPLIIAAFVSVLPAQAQNGAVSSRSFVPDPAALAMGDAAVAIPRAEGAFFYNPALLPSALGNDLRITLLGVRANSTSNVKTQVSFVQDDLFPAIDEGIDNLSSSELNTLYDDAIEVGRQPTHIQADVTLPSVMYSNGSFGVAAGVFANTATRYYFQPGGGGIPTANMYGRGDAMGVVSGAYRFNDEATVGLTGKYTRRYLTLKNRPIDALADEQLFLLRGDALSFDLGGYYEVSQVQGLQLGAVLYDVLHTGFAFEADESAGGLFGEDQGDPVVDAAQYERELAIAQDLHDVSASYRFGAAYVLPALGPIIRNTTVALDYLGYADPYIEQPMLAHLHVGASTSLAGVVNLRAGLNQGYTTLGLGLDVRFVQIDYAYYGSENGRLPGQLPSWQHTMQLRFQLP